MPFIAGMGSILEGENCFLCCPNAVPPTKTTKPNAVEAPWKNLLDPTQLTIDWCLERLHVHFETRFTMTPLHIHLPPPRARTLWNLTAEDELITRSWRPTLTNPRNLSGTLGFLVGRLHWGKNTCNTLQRGVCPNHYNSNSDNIPDNR